MRLGRGGVFICVKFLREKFTREIFTRTLSGAILCHDITLVYQTLTRRRLRQWHFQSRPVSVVGAGSVTGIFKVGQCPLPAPVQSVPLMNPVC
jgi:hypothetical protein